MLSSEVQMRHCVGDESFLAQFSVKNKTLQQIAYQRTGFEFARNKNESSGRGIKKINGATLKNKEKLKSVIFYGHFIEEYFFNMETFPYEFLNNAIYI